MAKGVVERATLEELANAIRERTATTNKMLPNAMPAMVRSISNEVYSGSYTLAGNAVAEFPLGASLPEYSNYVFMVFGSSGNFTGPEGGYNLVIGGVLTDGLIIDSEDKICRYNTADGIISINRETGIMTCPGLRFSSGTYNWWYFEVKGASA